MFSDSIRGESMRGQRAYHTTGVMLLATLLTACATGPECIEVEGGYNHRDPAYVVGLQDGVPIRETTEELAARYGFTPTKIKDADFMSTKGFTANYLSERAFDGLRCDPVVQKMYHNGRVGFQ